MKTLPALRFRFWSIIILLVFALSLDAPADPIPVRHVSGTIHGFLELRSPEGRVIASGDAVQVARGGQVTAHVLFRFNDGSIDDETTVFTQRRNFQLVTDHHVQKGPSFPHPMDMLIDCRTGTVTVRSIGKDGKEEVKTDHLALPPDLANGLVSFILANLPANAPDTTVPILVATPKPRLVKLAISSRGEESFSLAGSSRKATHYEIKIELGGVAGVVAPLVGKQPPDIQIWMVGGEAPTFLREDGPAYADGPVWTTELASPVWGDSAHPGN